MLIRFWDQEPNRQIYIFHKAGVFHRSTHWTHFLKSEWHSDLQTCLSIETSCRLCATYLSAYRGTNTSGGRGHAEQGVNYPNLDRVRVFLRKFVIRYPYWGVLLIINIPCWLPTYSKTAHRLRWYGWPTKRDVAVLCCTTPRD